MSAFRHAQAWFVWGSCCHAACLNDRERNHTIVEISLILFISLLTVCLGALLIGKNNPNQMDAKHSSWFSCVAHGVRRVRRLGLAAAATLAGIAFYASPVFAQSHQGGEANLILPDLSQVTFFGGVDGHRLLLVGIFVCLLGLGFGMAIYMNLKKLPVHRA